MIGVLIRDRGTQGEGSHVMTETDWSDTSRSHGTARISTC